MENKGIRKPKRKATSGSFKKGHKINLGKSHKVSEETKQKLRIANLGIPEELHSCWLGDKVGYMGLHRWVTKHLGRPKYCAYCQNSKLEHRQYHWANLSHCYKRDLSDWIRLCAKCHKLFDLGKIKLCQKE